MHTTKNSYLEPLNLEANRPALYSGSKVNCIGNTYMKNYLKFNLTKHPVFCLRALPTTPLSSVC